MAIIPPKTVSAPVGNLVSGFGCLKTVMRTFDEKQILPSLEVGLNLEDPECNESGKGSRNLTRSIEDAQSSCKFVSFVKSGEIEDYTWVESRFRHPKKPPRRHNSTKGRRGSTDHCHGAEYHHSDWKYEFGSEFLGEHVHWRACEDEWDVEDGEQDIVLVAFEVEVGGHAVCFGVSEVGLVDGADFTSSVGNPKEGLEY